MILIAFRNGLPAAELCDDFNGALLHVRRVKNGLGRAPQSPRDLRP
jgi:hypothetical protein